MMTRVASMGRVGVLYGGRSAERQISLMSGEGVHQALCRVGVDAHLFDTGRKSLVHLAEAGFDRVFIALHGRWGEDGTIQGALELLQLPYTGSSAAACALAMDKIMTKRVWLQQKLSTPDFVALEPGFDAAGVASQLGLPMIVKPSREGSTLGLTRARDLADLEAGYRLAAGFDPLVLAEQLVAGRELTVAVLGGGAECEALPVIEIVAPDGNYDYQNKYYSNDTRYLCPAELSEDTANRVRDLAVAAYRAVGCDGWGRVDIMLDSHGTPWLLEVNTSPGMTGHSLVPMAAAAVGLSYADLCLRILRSARCKLTPSPAAPQAGSNS